MTHTTRDNTLLHLMQPLQLQLERHDVTELTINQPGEYWTRENGGWRHHTAPELTTGMLNALSNAMIVYNGLAPAPVSSVVLPQGWRGQIVLPPAVIDGTVSLSIRKHNNTSRQLVELADAGAFEGWKDTSYHTPTADEIEALRRVRGVGRLDETDAQLLELKRRGDMPAFLGACVAHHRNVVIAGKTGSGKTTFARALIQAVPPEERLVTIEDVHELHLPGHPNRVHMLYGDGAGRISADACLASCMRQSPDRIFLAELRGNEAWEYLMALNTGHPGSVTTTHANSAVAAFERIALLVKKSPAGRDIDIDVIRQVLYSTVDVVLYFANWKLAEVFYDPIYARERITGSRG